MELPQSTDRLLRIAKLAAAIGCTVVAIIFLWRSVQWQNSIRELMQLETVDSAYPLEVGLIALAVFAILMALARLFRLTFGFVAIRVNRLLPRRISNVIGAVVAVARAAIFVKGHRVARVLEIHDPT